MDFKEHIQKKGVYNNLANYGHGIVMKYCKHKKSLINHQEREDIVSSVFEELSIKNPEVFGDVNGFKKGTFASYCGYKTLNFLKGKHKRRLVFTKVDFDVADKYYKEPDFLDVKKIKNKQLKKIITDKLDNNLTFEQVKIKYGIARQVLLDRIKRDIMGSKPKEKYKGVVRLINGKITKCYADICDVRKDAYDTTAVNRCCRGKLKSHKGVQFKWVKDLEIQNKAINE